jgi:hypothetical protein
MLRPSQLNHNNLLLGAKLIVHRARAQVDLEHPVIELGRHLVAIRVLRQRDLRAKRPYARSTR